MPTKTQQKKKAQKKKEAAKQKVKKKSQGSRIEDTIGVTEEPTSGMSDGHCKLKRDLLRLQAKKVHVSQCDGT